MYSAYKSEVAGTSLFTGAYPKRKSIGSGSDPESQAGRQSEGFGGWCLELRRGGRKEEVEKMYIYIYMKFIQKYL